jgi:hypothetical protein
MPVFTQQAPSYDVLVAADESGSSPLICLTEPGIRDRSPARPAWTDQLGRLSGPVGRDTDQNRFVKLNSRRMTALDMQAWTAVHDRRGNIAHQFR